MVNACPIKIGAWHKRRYNWIATLWGFHSRWHRRFGQLHIINSSRSLAKSFPAPNSDRYRGGPRRRGLTELLYHLRNDFNGTIDFSFSVESAERKTEAASGAIAVRIHCAQHMRSLLRTGSTGRSSRATDTMWIQKDERRGGFNSFKR